jgi:hypothetical protein
MLILLTAITITALLTYAAGKLDSRAYDNDVIVYDSSHRSITDNML